MRAIRIHKTGGPEVLQTRRGRTARSRATQARVRNHAIGVNLPRHLPSHRALPEPPSAHARLRRRGRGERAWRRRRGVQGRRPRRLCHDARLLRGAAQRRSQATRQAAGERQLRAGGGDDAERADRAIPSAPDLSGAEGRHDPGPRRGGRCWADPLPVGQASRRDGHRHRGIAGESQDRHGLRRRSCHRLRERGLRRPRRRRSPKAANAPSSTTASARRPSRPRSTACGRSACLRATGRRPGRWRRSTSGCSARRARCSRRGRRCSRSLPTAPGWRRWRRICSRSSAPARSRSIFPSARRSPRPARVHRDLEARRTTGSIVLIP